MQAKDKAEIPASYVMTSESVAAYLHHEIANGASDHAIRKYRRFTDALFSWLPEDKSITKERLNDWRLALKDHGYAPQTELNYVKGINRYLDFVGFSDARFNRGKAKDIAGKQFGYLTAIEPTGERDRKNVVWRCVCRCGKEVAYPATRLLLGNTVSCGCLRGDHFKEINKYIDGTSLRQSMEEQIRSPRARSGYTGVTAKRGRWKAYIKYKGQHIDLGCYTDLEDAVKARARGKEFVQADAMGLLDVYEALHQNDPALPDREKVREANKDPKQEQTPPAVIRAVRSNNTSGYPGVCRKRNKWAAKITYQKATYQLGTYDSMEEAIGARKEAEEVLRKDPEGFGAWIGQRQVRKQERA